MTSRTPSIVHWHFQCRHARSCRTHLHLQWPAVSFFPQVETIQGVATNRAEWSHVGGTDAVQDAQEKTNHVTGKNLVKVHAATFALAARARTDHELSSS